MAGLLERAGETIMAMPKPRFYSRLIIALALAGAGLWALSRPPADATLMANFYAHRAAFEQLKQMYLAEGRDLTLNTLGLTWNAGGAPEARRRTYQRLLWQVGVCCIGGSPAAQTMGLTVYPLIPWPGTPAKAYVHLPQPPAGLTTGDTQAYVFPPGQRPAICRPIEDAWYLCADYED